MESDKKICLDLHMYIMIYEHSLCFEARSVNDSPWYMLFLYRGSAKRFDVLVPSGCSYRTESGKIL